jgi:hypothetical protein
MILATVRLNDFEVGRDRRDFRTRRRRARRGFSKTVFTEGSKGNEATGVGSRQIATQALLLELI